AGTAHASDVTKAPSDNEISINKECVGVYGAGVCWIQFQDGTRCVVANDSESDGTSTALNCHFSNSMEKLHHRPKR
ncbi:MAG TPA: hypothetical protein VIV27_09045, partial [Halioglobus sp.]